MFLKNCVFLPKMFLNLTFNFLYEPCCKIKCNNLCRSPFGYHACFLGRFSSAVTFFNLCIGLRFIGYVLLRVIQALGLSLATFDVQYDDMKVIRTRVSECLVKRHAFILMHIA